MYGENARKIVPIDSPQFGRVMAVCVGAMMVGSIQTTVQEGEYVQRGQEFGYFAFGASFFGRGGFFFLTLALLLLLGDRWFDDRYLVREG